MKAFPFYLKTPENLLLWLSQNLWKMCVMQVQKSERKHKGMKYTFKISREIKGLFLVPDFRCFIVWNFRNISIFVNFTTSKIYSIIEVKINGV